jgi:hypothetical protein
LVVVVTPLFSISPVKCLKWLQSNRLDYDKVSEMNAKREKNHKVIHSRINVLSFDFLLFTAIDRFILRTFNLTLVLRRLVICESERILCLPLDGRPIRRLDADRFAGDGRGPDGRFATSSPLAGRCGGGLRRKRVGVTPASGFQGLGSGGLSGRFRDHSCSFGDRPTVAFDRHHGDLNAMWR